MSLPLIKINGKSEVLIKIYSFFQDILFYNFKIFYFLCRVLNKSPLEFVFGIVFCFPVEHRVPNYTFDMFVCHIDMN